MLGSVIVSIPILFLFREHYSRLDIDTQNTSSYDSQGSINGDAAREHSGSVDGSVTPTNFTQVANPHPLYS